MNIINFAQPVVGNFIVKILIWLAGITSSIAVAIVLFTVLLKLVTLPFDYFSKASMRKNSLKMEEMRPELEKLQKQYANDKALYNQKMMALYKKNGYSMFGSCLPTILTLVIFIFALNGFTDYSQYQNRLYFYNMSNAYNSVIYDGVEIKGFEEYITIDNDGNYIFSEKLYKDFKENNLKTGITVTETEREETVKVNNVDTVVKKGTLTVFTEGSYIILAKDGYIIPSEGVPTIGTATTFSSNKDLVENAGLKIVRDGNTLTYSQAETAGIKFKNGDKEEFNANLFILDIAQQKSADKYHEEQAKFLWIKNLWVSDSPMKSPVEESWATFRSTHEYPNSAHDIGEPGYAQLTMKLESEKTQSNGYFILVVLTAGISFLTQWVMKKSSQAQMELQTVDGQGAQTQKIMMIMMPIMMAFFAFMYTSAFSIYIILSSVINIGTTFGINKIVDVQFKKAKSKEKKDDKVRGRVYVPKEEPKQEQPKTKKKKVKEQGPDFLTGQADGKKKIRGRLK